MLIFKATFDSFFHVMNSFGKGFTRVANLLSAHRKPKPSSLSIAGDWFLTRALHVVYWDYQLEPEHLSHLSISLWIQSWILVRVCPLYIHCWQSLAPFSSCTSSKANRKLHPLPVSLTCLFPFEGWKRNGCPSHPLPTCVPWHGSLHLQGEKK